MRSLAHLLLCTATTRATIAIGKKKVRARMSHSANASTDEAGVKEDARLSYLKKEWFYGKRCLDIGCNTGGLLFAVGMYYRFLAPSHSPGRHFGFRSMLGVDIDGSLIRKAESIRREYVCNLLDVGSRYLLSQHDRKGPARASRGHISTQCHIQD